MNIIIKYKITSLIIFKVIKFHFEIKITILAFFKNNKINKIFGSDAQIIIAIQLYFILKYIKLLKIGRYILLYININLLF